MGGQTMEAATKPEQTTDAPSPRRICEDLANKGDLLGLLNYLEDEANDEVLHAALPLIDRCTRQKAKTDLPGLVEEVFARIVGMTTFLLVRVQLYIGARLRECERYGAHGLSKLPADLLDDGWLDRAERLSRFVMEAATIRARVKHVARLNNEGPKRQRQSPDWLNSTSAMAGGGIQASPGEARPCNGRLRGSTGRITFS